MLSPNFCSDRLLVPRKQRHDMESSRPGFRHEQRGLISQLGFWPEPAGPPHPRGGQRRPDCHQLERYNGTSMAYAVRLRLFFFFSAFTRPALFSYYHGHYRDTSILLPQ
jgi:hypothetical protein